MVPQLAAKCDQQRAAALSSPALRKTHISIVDAAKNGLVHGNSSLNDIRSRTKAIINEHETSTNELEQLLSSFISLSEAQNRLSAIEKCRNVADAYSRVLHPLNLHMRDGSLADMDTVAGNIETLISTVEIVRGNNNKKVNDLELDKKVISSVEKKAVDAVVKARAAFINVLDNEFRQFGWPMKIPIPGKNDKLINNIKSYVNQLNHLQRVSNDGDFIHERTKSRRTLSDNWAVSAILRTPLARFKYHFLEEVRASSQSSSNNNDIGTSRIDRPEWAAEFALERIRETTPFLSEIRIDGPHTTDVKFAEGFCRIFAEKIAYDCELALRTVKNDSYADVLITHASDTAKQFDNTLREGILSLKNRSSDKPLFQSSLHRLSLNESFLTTWASSELRLALNQVNGLLERALGKSRLEQENYDQVDTGGSSIKLASTRNELEQICGEIVNHIGSASQKCRAFESGERISTFLKLTESPILQTVRSRLRSDVEQEDFDSISIGEIKRCGRAALCAMLLSEALEDRSVDALYVSQEERLGQGFYDDDITRLRTLYSSTCTILSESISTAFIEKVRCGYGYYTRFGEVWAPDAAIVLTHDLSESLIEPLTSLEKSLSAVIEGVPCRRSASLVWRPVANKLDNFFFEEVVLQCFVGGTRNAVPAASEQNGFLTSNLCARMARQVASDVETFVSTFSVVSSNPSQFLAQSFECISIVRIASDNLLLPNVNPSEEDEELLNAIQLIADNPDDEDATKRVDQLLESRLNAVHICSRDALELIAISGHRSAIRLM